MASKQDLFQKASVNIVSDDAPTLVNVNVNEDETQVIPPKKGASFGFSTLILRTHLKYAGKVPPKHIVATALAGGTTVDLRGARLNPGETIVEAYAVCGSVRVVAPPNVRVVVDGIGLLAGYRDERTFYVPVEQMQDRWVRVRGAALCGGVKANFIAKNEVGRAVF